MSLTILVHRNLPRVGIIRWFLDQKVSVSYATGPLVHMSLEEFRSGGWNLIRRHFEEYLTVRISEGQAMPVFEPGEEKKYLKECRAVRIRREDSGKLTLIPQKFVRYSVGGLESLGNESRRTIPENSPPDVFWKAFDEVIAIAPEAV